ncbi:dehydrogenase/reductase sdr family member 4-like [Dermatophagoides farinae]|uniref:Dehydrogenase/reductase sdr family member 4-like n=1 Tax=Dermatophagoides farinae TaxID=6954 RepID=A0A9D4SG21_DERFA|nr:dehydrogenase/reductase sdr family member 4-like [Dermatophagoides farinae]
MTDRYNIHSQLEHLQSKYIGTGHADTSKFEWMVNQHRDTYASYLGHPDMLSFFSIAENESIGRIKFNMMEKMLQPCAVCHEQDIVMRKEIMFVINNKFRSIVLMVILLSSLFDAARTGTKSSQQQKRAPQSDGQRISQIRMNGTTTDSDYDFTGKVVLITGSSGGLGAHIAREFCKRGSNVVINGRRQSSLQSMLQECQMLSPNQAEMLAYIADVTVKEQLKSMVDATIDKFGKIDILVNNAGGGAFGSIFDEDLDDKVHRMMDLNLHSVVRLTQYAAPHLERTKGNIVTISSILGQQPNQHFMPYCVAKAAVDMFCKSIAIELGPKGVRVNYVSPTAMRTNFQQASGAGEVLKGVLSHLEQTIPMRRIGQIEDVGNAVLFLASDKSSFITGANIVIDGGNSLI